MPGAYSVAKMALYPLVDGFSENLSLGSYGIWMLLGPRQPFIEAIFPTVLVVSGVRGPWTQTKLEKLTVPNFLLFSS